MELLNGCFSLLVQVGVVGPLLICFHSQLVQAAAALLDTDESHHHHHNQRGGGGARQSSTRAYNWPESPPSPFSRLSGISEDGWAVLGLGISGLLVVWLLHSCFTNASVCGETVISGVGFVLELIASA